MALLGDFPPQVGGFAVGGRVGGAANDHLSEMRCLSSTRDDGRLFGGPRIGAAIAAASGTRSSPSRCGHGQPLGGQRVGGVTDQFTASNRECMTNRTDHLSLFPQRDYYRPKIAKYLEALREISSIKLPF
jgi:hypothetical protein